MSEAKIMRKLYFGKAAFNRVIPDVLKAADKSISSFDGISFFFNEQLPPGDIWGEDLDGKLIQLGKNIE